MFDPEQEYLLACFTFSCNWIQRRTQITRSLYIHINIIESRKSEERCRLYPNSTCRQTCMFVGTNKSLVFYTINGSNESVAKWRWEMYLSISHYHFIVCTPRFIIYCSIRGIVWRQWTKYSFVSKGELFLFDDSTIIDLFASDILKNKRRIYTHLILFTFIDDFFSYKSLVDQMIIIRINFFFLNI